MIIKSLTPQIQLCVSESDYKKAKETKVIKNIKQTVSQFANSYFRDRQNVLKALSNRELNVKIILNFSESNVQSKSNLSFVNEKEEVEINVFCKEYFVFSEQDLYQNLIKVIFNKE